jgi:hypothetical protein
VTFGPLTSDLWGRFRDVWARGLGAGKRRKAPNLNKNDCPATQLDFEYTLRASTIHLISQTPFKLPFLLLNTPSASGGPSLPCPLGPPSPSIFNLNETLCHSYNDLLHDRQRGLRPRECYRSRVRCGTTYRLGRQVPRGELLSTLTSSEFQTHCDIYRPLLKTSTLHRPYRSRPMTPSRQPS